MNSTYSRPVETVQPFHVRASCGHVVIRKMREATAGIAYTPDVILDAPNGRACPTCEIAANQPVRGLVCCCCAGHTRGRQWRNRDAGYGMCLACITYVRSHGETEDQIRDCYGVQGIHWGVE